MPARPPPQDPARRCFGLDRGPQRAAAHCEMLDAVRFRFWHSPQSTSRIEAFSCEALQENWRCPLGTCHFPATIR